MRGLTQLLASLALLTSTATASAECAWVLWEHVWYTDAKTYLRSGHTWTPTGAVNTHIDCERGQAATEQEWRTLRKLSPSNDPNHSVQWICLPDTVDPRGPKTK